MSGFHPCKKHFNGITLNDGVARRTEPLMRVSATRRETAVQLPLSVHAVEIEYRGTREKIDVPLDGRTVKIGT